MTCPGSVVLSEGMPERTSEFAEEGTRAHAVAEARLSVGAQNFVGTTPEMLSHVETYVDHVNGLFNNPGAVQHVEQRVAVTDDVYGTADAVVWQPADQHLHIVDLKYGAGVPVEVVDNLQLRIYALAALLTFKYPARQVTATIVQPRCPHPDGPVRSVTFDVVDLIEFHADLRDAVERVRQAQTVKLAHPAHIESHLQPSEKGCRWCLAAPKCPALKSKAQELAKRAFAAGVPGMPYDPLELARTLDFLPILEAWIKNTREFAYAEAEKGHDIPDYKLVEKRATRKWRELRPVDYEKLYDAGLSADQMLESKLKSPAEIEKLLPKEKRDLLDELTVKESSGHTLVHESDKRPAIKVDAKSAFATS